MRIVVQRVRRAAVDVGGEKVAEIGRGLLLLVGIERGDSAEDAERAAHRMATLRVFEDGDGHMNLGLDDIAGEILVVSQFTLAGSIRRGRRPDLVNAARPEDAAPLVEALAEALARQGARVQCGVFRAHMEVDLVNDGPVTFVWESR